MRGAIGRYAVKAGSVLSIAILMIGISCSKLDQSATTPPLEGDPVGTTVDIFNRELFKDQLTIRYFHLEGNVSTGDSILIQTPDGKTMLIDAGIAAAGEQIVAYLDKLGIDSIDIALNTHPHPDHIGGFATVLQKKKASAFYSADFPYASASYRAAMDQVKAQKIPQMYLEEGVSFQLGSDVNIEVLRPNKGALPDAITSDDTALINHHSLVMRIIYKGVTFLTTGDIYKEREAELIESGIDLAADIVHVPHHGHATSSSEAFVRAVKPKIALMGANVFNSYAVEQTYRKADANVYSTGMNGHILIATDGSSIRVIPEKDVVPPAQTAEDVPPLLITELVPGGQPFEYLQLYNTTDQPIDLSRYKIHYYYDPGAEKPWESKVTRWDLTQASSITSSGASPTDMTIQPHSTKIVRFVRAANPVVSVSEFNRFYGTDLASDQFIYAKLGSGHGISDDTKRYLAIVAPRGHQRFDRISMIEYNPQAATGKCEMNKDCDANIKEAIAYYYPKQGLDPERKLMERRVPESLHQQPLPGQLRPGQAPQPDR